MKPVLHHSWETYLLTSRKTSRFFLLVVFFTSVIHVSFSQTGTRTINSSGTFIVPDRITSVNVSVWGAGGGGGWTNNNRGAGGGGGGAFTQATNFPVLSGSNINVIVGIGGVGQANGVPAGIGGISSFESLSANGGNGANGQTSGAGGIAGTGAYFYRSGGTSTNAPNSGNGPGRGGASAGSSLGNGTGSNNQNGSVGLDGAGSGGNGGGANVNGSNGDNAGGGGGGEGGSGAQGGNGGNGRIIVSWTCSATLSSGLGSNIQSVCFNTPIADITYELVGSYGATFSGLPSGVTGTYSNGDVIISGAPDQAGTFDYTITTVGDCATTILTGTISVTPNRAAGTITSNTFCEGSPLPGGVIQPISGATGIDAAIGLPAGISVVLVGNDIVFSGTPTESGSFDYTIPFTDGCGTENATGTILVNSITAINDPLLGGQISCLGSTFSPISISPGFGFTYQWYENAVAENFGGTPVVGANSHEFIPSTSSLGTLYYYVEVTGLCGDPLVVSSPVSGAFEVFPGNAADPASISPVVCVNEAIPDIFHLTSEATGIGAPVNLPPGVDAIWAADEITISGTPTQSGVFNYSIPLTGGCGTASATGTITVNAIPNIPGQVTPAQEICENANFSAIGVVRLTGLSYQWYSNTVDSNTGGTLISGANGNIFTPPSNAVGTMYYYVEVTSNFCGIGDVVYSNASGAQTVNPLPVVTFESQPLGDYCVDQDITYTTQAGQSDYLWTLPGILGTDYTIIGGGNDSDEFITVRWLTPGSKSISVNYANSNGCFAASPIVSTPINVQINTFTPSVPLAPRVCANEALTPFTITTTLATGIGTPTGLPTGVTASFSGNTITISGTPTVPGTYNYSIPLTGGCGTVNAVGTMVVSPVYTLTSTTSISPSTPGGSTTVTIRGDVANLPNGVYTVTYQMGLANSGGPYTATVNVVNGRGSFNTVPVFDPNLTSLEILTIRRPIDTCTINLTQNNITFFGICAAVYENDGFFYVPAGIFEITVKVWGGGGKGGNSTSNSVNGGGGGGGGYSTITVPVNPGQIIRVNIGLGGTPTTPNGGTTFVTRSTTDDLAAAILYAMGGNAGTTSAGGTGGIGNAGTGQNGANGATSNGGNGGQGAGGGGAGGLGATATNNSNSTAGSRPGGGGGGARGSGRIGRDGGAGLVIISYSCPPISPDDCFEVIDDGARTGNTIIRFTCETNEWFAPQGLLDFTVHTVGAGGGGGMGNTGGGGGGGGLVTQMISSSDPNGIPDNSMFTINVGRGGTGATTVNQTGQIGGSSSFTGLLDGIPILVSAPGGGGGGSFSTGAANGTAGASGGGGAYYVGSPSNYSGLGGSGTSGLGNNGGIGAVGSGSSPAVSGGGGGGANGPGGNGTASGSGQSRGGNGGPGRSIDLPVLGPLIAYGAGGGGIGFNGNGTDVPGVGGSASSAGIIGGNANRAGIGFPGVNGTGSGGGAGRTGGGNGGHGVVYIIYENFKILPVEYIYIKARYVEEERIAELTWATSKEWENSHFEVQRSFQNVKNWSTVGRLEGMGYSDEPVFYKFEDKELPLTGGNLYYRLKQVDYSGKFDLSRVLSVRLPPLQFTKGVWRAYPNPTNGESLTISLLDKNAYDGESLIFRIIHPTMVTNPITVANENEMNQILGPIIGKIPRGVFVVEIRWGQKIEHIKVLRK